MSISDSRETPTPAPYLFQTKPTTGDFAGGLAVALVLIPQAIAYATIAGLPPQSGLFAATLPLIFAAPFVSCPWLQTGPVALTSLLTLGALQSVASSSEQPLSTEQLIGAACVLAVIVGVTRFLMGALRLGGFTRLLSWPVVLGFTTAAAILIISSQLSKVLGTPHDEINVLVRAIRSLGSFSWSISAILIAVGTGIVVHFSRRIHRLFPSILTAVVLAIIVSRLTGYSGAVVGDLDGEFFSFRFQLPWNYFFDLLVPGVIIAFIGFAEPASISMTLMDEENMEWNPNRELCGGGFANTIAGFIGGYPVGGSFSRTSINKFAGAETAWSGAITGMIVLCSLRLTPYLSALPESALGAIIIMAVVRLIKIKEIIEVWKARPIYGMLAVTTLICTLVTAPNVERGIIVGVIFGFAVRIYERKNR